MFPLLLLGVVATAILASCKNSPSESDDNLARPVPFESASEPKETPVPSGLSPESNLEPCPPEMAAVDRFCIDRYEAHLLVEGELHPHNYRPPDGGNFEATSSSGTYPQAYISRTEAEAACRRSMKRLCTLKEWLAACRGPSQSIFPYGNNYEKGRCNSGKPHLLTLLFKDKGPMTWTYDNHFNNPALNETPGYLAKTGEYAECVGLYGVFDMVGNLHEWVSDKVDRMLAGKLALIPSILAKLKVNYGHGIFMGGFYSTGAEHGYGCGFITIGHEPEYHDYSTGFRCCKEMR